MTDKLDDYIDAVAAALSLPIADDWKPAVKMNLEVSLRMAAMVEGFPLSDESEPASIYVA